MITATHLDVVLFRRMCGRALHFSVRRRVKLPASLHDLSGAWAARATTGRPNAKVLLLRTQFTRLDCCTGCLTTRGSSVGATQTRQSGKFVEVNQSINQVVLGLPPGSGIGLAAKCRDCCFHRSRIHFGRKRCGRRMEPSHKHLFRLKVRFFEVDLFHVVMVTKTYYTAPVQSGFFKLGVSFSNFL